MTTPDKIIDAIERVFGVRKRDLRGQRRHRNLADARVAAGYFLMTEGNADRKDMPKLLNRTRAWSSFAIYRCPELAEMDKRFGARVQQVYNTLKGAAA